MKIIDVSKWQGNINWAKAAKDVSLAILRVQDAGHYDEKIEQNIAGCQNNKIPFGVYAFFRASTPRAAVEECKLFLSRTKAAGGGALFYVLDCETDEPNKKSIAAAVQYLHAQGVRVGVYFAHHMYRTYGGNYGQDFTWIPRYGKSPKYPCDLWQYTSKGDCEGIKGDVDLNCINSSKTLDWYTGVPVKPVTPQVKSGDKVHTVKRGDTLSAIAKKYNTTWRKLATYNHIDNPDLLHVGQKIKIPGK